MNAHAAMVMFIVSMLLAAGVVAVFDDVVKDRKQSPAPEPLAGQPEIIGVSAWGVEERAARYVTVRVAGGGEPQNLSTALLTLSTESGSVSHTLS